MSITLYGIKACDTMKKARTWLDEHGVSYTFHDYKASAIDSANLHKWCDEHGWDEASKTDLDQSKAIALMLAQPSLIKRPVLDLGERTLLGFKAELYAQALA